MAPEAPGSIRFHALPLKGIEAMWAETARSFTRHTHDTYGIGVVLNGGHASWSDIGRVEAGPGSFISVNPGEVHDGHAVGARPRRWRIVYLEPALIRELGEDTAMASRDVRFLAPVFDDPDLRRPLDALFTAEADALAFETHLLSLIAGLSRHCTGRARSEDIPADVRRVRERIDADPAANPSLADLAREVSLSRFQLLRAFTRATGLPPHAYRLQRRLAQARRLLLSGEAPADVAVTTGFADQSHLTRCFARQFGVPPSRYAARR